MKRLYTLISALMLLTGFCTSASTVLNYGYCTDEILGIGCNSPGKWMAAAVKIPAEQAQAFAGSRITHISVGFARSTPKRVYVFLSHDLTQPPFYTQTANLRINQFNNVPLLETYTLGNEDIYVGYYIQTTMADDMPIGSDRLTSNYSDLGDLLSLGDDQEGLCENWTHIGSSYGNVSVRALIEGESFPGWERRVRALDALVPGFNKMGTPFTATLGIQNEGAEPIASLKVRVGIGEESPREFDVTLPEQLVSPACTLFDLEGLVSNTAGQEVPVRFDITGINGADVSTETSVTRTFLCSEYLTNRPLVVEELTATDCGYCPRGFVMLEQMREKHTDGSFIGIGVHLNRASRDPMHCQNYKAWQTRFLNGQGYPKAICNRRTIIDPHPSTIGSYYDAFTALTAKAGINVSAEFTDNSKSAIRMNATVRALKPISSHNYGIAVALTEDQLGPYQQTNYYANNAMGVMGGFENLGSQCMVVFNDVARDIFDWEGDPDALPASLDADTDYSYVKEIPTSACTNPDNARVIALLIDRSTGEIENAAAQFMTTSGISDRELIREYNMTVRAEGGAGTIRVMGDTVDNAWIYTPSGTLAATLEGAGTVSLTPGIYIVAISAEGRTHTAKIQVK